VLCEPLIIGIVGHVFIEQLNVLQNDIVLFLISYSADKAWSQQGGMRLHRAGTVLDFSEKIFRNQVLSNRLPHVHGTGSQWPHI
jgi:hypothetical protein